MRMSTANYIDYETAEFLAKVSSEGELVWCEMYMGTIPEV